MGWKKEEKKITPKNLAIAFLLLHFYIVLYFILLQLIDKQFTNGFAMSARKRTIFVLIIYKMRHLTYRVIIF